MSRLQNVRDVSITAYYQMVNGPQLGEQQRSIYRFLCHNAHRDYTRAELAADVGIRINAVCPRVLELIERGVLVERPARKCKLSGRSAHPVSVAPQQTELFA